MAHPSRSPILRRLLKLPGEDADGDLQDFVEDRLIAPLLMLLVIATICLVEWIHYWTHSPPNPWIYTCWFVATAAAISYHWVKEFKVARAKKLGRDGERAVSEYLNVWMATDARVLHNVPLGGGIADHILICQKGVFVIETKTRSLPRTGKPVVHISDTAALRVGGFVPDRDPIAQTERYLLGLNAILPAGKLGESINGIVLFPGWNIVDDRRSTRTIAVLNPRELDDYLNTRRDDLTAADVAELTKIVARHCKSILRSHASS